MDGLMGNVALGITAAIVAVMVWALLKGWGSENSARWASYLVSLGIFGTFLGITVALIGFDASAVEDSVPELLAGMRIAFVSSAVGIFFSLLLRTGGLSSRDGAAKEGRTVDDLHSAMVAQQELLAGIRGALVGEGDRTLITQLALLRSEARDGLAGIRTSLQEFAETLAESNSEALFAALEGAVRDFNEKISEQFGENFKQLNVAVGRLLEWQQQYRTNLENTQVLLQQATDRLRDASDRLSEIAEQTSALREVSEKQDRWLQAQITSQAELEARLQAFSDMAEEARSALPVVQQNLEEVTEGAKRTIRDTLAAVEGMVETLEAGLGGTTRQMEATSSDFATKMQGSVGELERQLLEATAKSNRRLEESVEEFDRMLGEELSKSLQTLGNQLATLSNRFVEDYSPLTDSLRRVVEISRRLEA